MLLQRYRSVVICVFCTLSIVMASLMTGCNKCEVTEIYRVSLDGMYPDCGSTAGGTKVTIYGWGLDKVVQITMHPDEYTLAAGDFTPVNDREITFTTQAHREGPVRVMVKFEDDFECIKKNGKVKYTETRSKFYEGSYFTYIKDVPWVQNYEPYPMGTDPNEGNCGGGYPIDIHGGNFGSEGDEDVKVTFITDGTTCPGVSKTMVAYPDVKVVSDNLIQVLVPAGPMNCLASVIVHKGVDCDVKCDVCGSFFYKEELCEYPEEEEPDIRYFPAERGPIKLATGDVYCESDPDPGYRDVVAICSGSNSLIVYAGMGDGNIRPVDCLDFDTSPIAVALGDFDDNTYDDAVVLLEDGMIWVLYNDGTGYSKYSHESDILTYFEGMVLADIAVLDIDHDPKSLDDIVVANQSGENGTLGCIIQTVPMDLDLATDDIVVTHRANLPTEGFSLVPVSLAKGDYNLDYGYDLLVATSRGTIELLSTASYPPQFTSYAEITDESGDNVLITDMTSCRISGDDADMDIAAIAETKNMIYLVQGNRESGSFAAEYTTLTLEGSSPAVLAEGYYCDASSSEGYGISDFAAGGGDGKIDVILRGTGVSDPVTAMDLFTISDMTADFLNSLDATTFEDLVAGGNSSTVVVIVNKGSGF